MQNAQFIKPHSEQLVSIFNQLMHFFSFSCYSYNNIVKNYEKFKKNITYRLVNLGVQLIHLRVHRPIWCLDYMLPQSITIYNSSKIPQLSQEMRVNYQGEAQGGGGGMS